MSEQAQPLAIHPLETLLDLTPRTYDIDFAGVVSNIVYVRWLEDLRLEMLRRFLPLPELMERGLAPTILSTTIEYKYPVRLFDPIRGAMWLTDLGRSSWELTARFTHQTNGKVAAEAVQKGLLLDIGKGRPGKIPDALRERYRQETNAPSR
ncbi:acyl-CoA thioesterase [Candidatus Thiosymbion oneisti]|uniref:acyl-CoA thioesterase n=1 Tax=Candidatus Thiosymbion oneisti TaxID=589554 RepID=UPI000A9FA026|nr:thioesterase family protein [Candidatus Thiosymbion oneisti]